MIINPKKVFLLERKKDQLPKDHSIYKKLLLLGSTVEKCVKNCFVKIEEEELKNVFLPKSLNDLCVELGISKSELINMILKSFDIEMHIGFSPRQRGILNLVEICPDISCEERKKLLTFILENLDSM